MNLQLHHVVSEVDGATCMRINRANVAGGRTPATLATMRDTRCKSSRSNGSAASHPALATAGAGAFCKDSGINLKREVGFERGKSIAIPRAVYLAGIVGDLSTIDLILIKDHLQPSHNHLYVQVVSKVRSILTVGAYQVGNCGVWHRVAVWLV